MNFDGFSGIPWETPGSENLPIGGLKAVPMGSKNLLRTQMLRLVSHKDARLQDWKGYKAAVNNKIGRSYKIDVNFQA